MRTRHGVVALRNDGGHARLYLPPSCLMVTVTFGRAMQNYISRTSGGDSRRFRLVGNERLATGLLILACHIYTCRLQVDVRQCRGRCWTASKLFWGISDNMAFSGALVSYSGGAS